MGMSEFDIEQAALVVTGGVVHAPNFSIYLNGQATPLASLPETDLRALLAAWNKAERRRLSQANFPLRVRWVMWLVGSLYTATIPVEAFGSIQPELVRIAMIAGWLMAVYLFTESRFGQRRRRNLRVADHIAGTIAAVEAELDRRDAMRRRSIWERCQDVFDTLRP